MVQQLNRELDDQDLAILRYISKGKNMDSAVVERYRAAMTERGGGRHLILPALFVRHPYLLALIEPVEKPRNNKQTEFVTALRIAMSVFEASLGGAKSLTERPRYPYLNLVGIALIEGICLPIRFLVNRVGAPWTRR